MNGTNKVSTPPPAKASRKRFGAPGAVLTSPDRQSSKLMTFKRCSGHSSAPRRADLGAGTRFSPRMGGKGSAV